MGKVFFFQIFSIFQIWFSLEDIEDNPDDRIREQSESNPKTWQEKIRGDKYEEDKHIFQYKPLPWGHPSNSLSFSEKNMSRNIMPEKASSALGLPMPSSNTAGRMVHPLDGANFIKAQEQEDMKLALKSQVI